MNQEPETICSGVICLFCGICTRLPAGLRASEGWRRVVIVHCQVCGKEAPYHATELIQFEERSISANSLAPASERQLGPTR
jgi:hypothetical protein